MSEQKHKPWVSRGDEFPWLREREELVAEQQVRKERGEFELDESGYRKLSRYAPVDELLNFAWVARYQPEIWELIQGIVERHKLDSETEVTNDEYFFFVFFTEWYLKKHDLAYYTSSFGVIFRLLLQIGHKKIQDDLNSEEVKSFLLADPFVIDKNGMVGENK